MACCNLEECLVDGPSNSRDEVCHNHVPYGLHLSLPHGRREHDQSRDDVHGATPHAEGDGDEDDAADGQAGHAGCVAVV